MEDPDRFFAKGGALEALTAAKQAGKIRFIGFTGHKDPAVHLRMLDVASQHGFHFDSCQMPLNVMDAHFRSFAAQVVPRLVKEGIAVLEMKPLGSGMILKSNTATPIECLHYALNLPTSVVITGCDSMERLNQAFDAARTFQPMNEQQLTALLDKTRLGGDDRRIRAVQDDADVRRNGPESEVARLSLRSNYLRRKLISMWAATATGCPSFSPGLNRHWLTASTALSASPNPTPWTTRTFRGVPSGSMLMSRTAVPWYFAILASWLYSELDLCKSFGSNHAIYAGPVDGLARVGLPARL